MLKDVSKILFLKVLNTIVGAVGFGLLAYFTIRSEFEFLLKIAGIVLGLGLITTTFIIRTRLGISQNNFSSSGLNIVFSSSFIDNTYSLIIFIVCPTFVIVGSKGENYTAMLPFILCMLISPFIPKIARINTSLFIFCAFVLCVAFEHWVMDLSPSIALFSLFISRQGITSTEVSSSKNLINYFAEESLRHKTTESHSLQPKITAKSTTESFWLTAEKTRVSISADRKTITLSTQEAVFENTEVLEEYFRTYFQANKIKLNAVSTQKLGNLTKIICQFDTKIYTATSVSNHVAITNLQNMYKHKIESHKVIMASNVTDYLENFYHNLKRINDRYIYNRLTYCERLFDHCQAMISNHQRSFFFYAPNLMMQEVLFVSQDTLFTVSVKHVSVEVTGRPIDGLFRSKDQINIDVKAGHEIVAYLVEIIFRVNKTLNANQFHQAEKFALTFLKQGNNK